MNWWLLYPMIGVAIGIGLISVDATDVDDLVVMILLTWLWPLAVPFLIWHGITVLQWKRARRRRGDGAEMPPSKPKFWQRTKRESRG